MFKLGVAGAVQITGSHNPPEFNGFKMSRNKKAVFGDDIQSLYSIIQSEDYEIGEGAEAPYDILSDYKRMVVSKINLDKDIKKISNHIGVEIKLGERHVGKQNHRHYSFYYNENSIEMIKERFWKDIEVFNYKYETA